MSFSTFFKKATNLLGLSSPESARPPPLDGEIIYCKNNVCVHPPALLRAEADHYPGYLNIRSQSDEDLGSTLILTWIPNSTLKKNPRSIENSPKHPGVSTRRSPRQEYAHSEQTTPSPGVSPISSPIVETLFEKNCDDKDYVDPLDFHVKKKMKDKYLESNKADDGEEVDSAVSNKPTSGGLNDSKHYRHKGNDTDVSTESKNSGSNCHVRDRQKEHIRKERTSSGRSVTSIEMEGDNLVVVTEEIDESAFIEEKETKQTAPLTDRISSSQNAQNSSCSSSPDSMSISSGSTDNGPSAEHHYQMLKDLNCKKGDRTTCNQSGEQSSGKLSSMGKLKDSLDLTLDISDKASPATATNIQTYINTPDIEISSPVHSYSSTSTPTSGPDSSPPSPITPPRYSPFRSPDSPKRLSMSQDNNLITPNETTYTIQHNMSFPENTVVYSKEGEAPPKSAKDQLCGVFSVDLGQMRSLRIFYSNDSCTNGQLVIASRESQYKVLHFHHGGLDRLAEIFSEWTFLAQPKQRKEEEVDRQCKQFSVIRPYLPNSQRHPEEGAYEKVNDTTWKQHMNELGQIEDDFHLRKAIFFAGLEQSVRHEMWPFLLHYFPYRSTYEEREQIRNDKFIDYQNLRKERESMSQEEHDKFWRTTQCTVEKDVVRTDRSHPYYEGDDNANIEILKSILLNYAVAHPDYGYTQGMSDLLAPVLAEVQKEVDSYWCFEGLMQKTIFVSSPKDIDMDKQLNYLRGLLNLMLPRFYSHLQRVQDGLELLFCHRWILLCFKREFPEQEALSMWEACWAHFQTDYFHLFLCVAIIAVYGEDVLQQCLPADEMLLHFSSLSMHMSGHVILRKARGLLHQFRTLDTIPCTLSELCSLCSRGMWDSGHVPTVNCVGNHPGGECPHASTPSSG